MTLNILNRNLEINSNTREYVIMKFSRVLRHCSNIEKIQVTFSSESIKYKAEVNLHLNGKDIHCEVIHSNLRSAIDSLVSKFDQQIIKYKNKIQSFKPDSVKYFSLED